MDCIQHYRAMEKSLVTSKAVCVPPIFSCEFIYLKLYYFSVTDIVESTGIIRVDRCLSLPK